MMMRKKRDSSSSMIMRRIYALCLAISVFALLIIASCGTKKAHINTAKGPSWNAERLLVASRDSARESMNETNRRKAKELATQGVEYAERCLMLLPEEAGCYYWRAVNTGLYYRVHIIGYQRGVKKMIEDCHKVIDIDGARVLFDDGWGLVRASNTQPALVLRFEALSEKRLKEIKTLIESNLERIKKEVG